MVKRRFSLDARVDTDSPETVEPLLRRLIMEGSVEEGSRASEFHVKAQIEGENARDLNRTLLSALRRAEKKTRLRAEWTGPDGTVYRFFDYVLKKTS
jgi:hypothetical protein